MVNRRQLLRRGGLVAGGVGVFAAGYFSRRLANSSADNPRSTAGKNTYFVSPEGSESNPGTKDQPFERIETATDAVDPGDTVFLRGGNYDLDQTVELRNVSGTTDNRITIAGYPSERPVLRFDGPEPQSLDPRPGIKMDNVDYVTIENMAIRDSPRRGLLAVESTNNEFRNLVVMNNNHAGIGLHRRSSNNLVRNVVSSNNYDRETNGKNADGIQCSYSTNNRIVGCELFNNSDDGLDLWACTACEVERSKSWNNGRDEGNGNGFKLGGSPEDEPESESGGHEVIRNVAFQNENIGFSYNLAAVPIQLYNNTAWQNAINYWFERVDHRLVNNLSANGDESLDGNITTTTNNWDLGITNPMFRSRNADSDHFLRLGADSPCVDAGTEVGVAYSGNAPDLGAYEYHPTDE